MEISIGPFNICSISAAGKTEICFLFFFALSVQVLFFTAPRLRAEMQISGRRALGRKAHWRATGVLKTTWATSGKGAGWRRRGLVANVPFQCWFPWSQGLLGPPLLGPELGCIQLARWRRLN